jgi:hypothetical protein
MASLWADNVVDEGVAAKWKSTMQTIEKRIEKLDLAMQFWKEQ